MMPLNREIICIYWLKFLLGVFIKKNEVFYYAERKLKNIPIGQITGVSAMPGNVAYLFFNEKKERLFELQMKKANARKMLEYIIDRQQNN